MRHITTRILLVGCASLSLAGLAVASRYRSDQISLQQQDREIADRRMRDCTSVTAANLITEGAEPRAYRSDGTVFIPYGQQIIVDRGAGLTAQVRRGNQTQDGHTRLIYAFVKIGTPGTLPDPGSCPVDKKASH